jgi:DNA-binding CsgD family transcriptional regulator
VENESVRCLLKRAANGNRELRDYQRQSDLAFGGRVSSSSLPDPFPSTYLSDRQFRALGLHRDFYRPAEVNYQLTITLPGPRRSLIGVALNRTHTDFRDEDQELLNLLRQHIGRAAAIGILLSEPSPLAPLTLAATPLLTARQSRVLQLVSAGYDDRSIGRALGISPRTVHTHLQHVYRALGVTSRTEALAQLRMTACHGSSPMERELGSTAPPRAGSGVLEG